ncbi:probable mediator of RNA polymerase II transcription subunit 26c [Morus notabilis]|uniref:probable mediator of RNA polymerase II transcription subunit 26c n=1 Tax=Morus notabilis TaxID=981085 RepID=UPI000CED4CF2|nr:probable mediator of RNA polymerase II transcription subunit 26c [Morus notabilis]XP_024028875.1 probable mediator of RNA polymerase II transcription subunit 26c [Morus notabilis]XP_024028881.1 probable mediator of RNA polymerase II transcription subunit 26c [Morus notabilis]XP_024028886.1 probable mediator of RNA polymerase II transcription subunit 26c [Morus notabilis]
MDYDDFRAILDSSGVDVWTFIDTAIAVASMDYGGELRQRRDGIVERLYAASSSSSASDHHRPRHYDREAKTAGEKERVSPPTPQSIDRENSDNDGEGLDPYGGLFDDEQKKILEIKEQLEDSDQSEDTLVELLQSLADMDITFQALKETDIGRHVNRLRKHPSSEVKRLVKQVVRKWKDTVDEWVKLNQPGEHASNSLMDGDSPQQKIPQNGHHQVPDFAYSPNPHNGSSGSDKNNSEPEQKPKAVPSRREALPKPMNPSVPQSAHSTPQNRQREQREGSFDAEKLASARKRLQENYKEAENAKKQRTIQVMDIHEIPKPKAKNAFFPKNKGGGGGSLGRHW